MDDQQGRDELNEAVYGLRMSYNPPPETPRDEMWAAIEAALEPRRGMEAEAPADVIPLHAGRVRPAAAPHRMVGWAVAAAALVVLGIGIGRMSAPAPARVASAAAVAGDVPNPTAMRVAAMEHLGQTESLLTVVRADARTGHLDPQVGPWARDLLTRTRMLLDAPDEKDPAMRQLLEDLELVLVQIVGVTDTGPHGTARTRTELNLAMKGLEDRDVLPRIQAVVPAGSALSGTD